MKKVIDDNGKQQLLDKLSEESIMVLETAYVYAKNYVLYGADITKPWATAVQQASALEQVRIKAFKEAYNSFKKDYENCFKEDMVAMLTDIQLEIEEQSLTHSEDNILSEWGLGYNHSVERCGELIQTKINALKVRK